MCRRRRTRICWENSVVFHASRMQRSLQSGPLRRPRRTAPLPRLRHAAAGALRLEGGARLEEGLARGARAEHVAVSRADAALRRRAADHAWGGLDAAYSRHAPRRRARARRALTPG